MQSYTIGKQFSRDQQKLLLFLKCQILQVVSILKEKFNTPVENVIKDIRIIHRQGDFLKSNCKIARSLRKRLKSTNKVEFSRWFAYLNNSSAKHKTQFLNPDVHFKSIDLLQIFASIRTRFFSFLSISIVRAALFPLDGYIQSCQRGCQANHARTNERRRLPIQSSELA